jgi:hypothetical protein
MTIEEEAEEDMDEEDQEEAIDLPTTVGVETEAEDHHSIAKEVVEQVMEEKDLPTEKEEVQVATDREVQVMLEEQVDQHPQDERDQEVQAVQVMLVEKGDQVLLPETEKLASAPEDQSQLDSQKNILSLI